MKHDPHVSPNLPRFMRTGRRKVSSLLEAIVFTKRHGVDYHLFPKVTQINGNGFLVNFLNEYDDSRVYLAEAEAKTKSTKDFIADFVSFCKDKPPNEVFEVTFDQLYRDGDHNSIVKKPPIISDEDQDISPMICLALPFYAESKIRANTLIREFVEIAVEDGYFLSNFSTVECMHRDGLEKDVSIVYLTFEAKYTNLDVKLEGNLYHVTTTKFIKDIAKNGLVPKTESREFEYPPRIFLFNRASYDLILEYGKNKAKTRGKYEFFVLRIDRKSIEGYQPFKSGEFVLYRDPAFSGDDKSTDQTAIFTYDPIPRSLICDSIARYDVNSAEPSMMKLDDL